jgi:hypothetical protein
MVISEEIQLGDQRTLTLLKQIWVIWTGLSAFYALIGILAIFMGIISIFQGSPNVQIGMGVYINSAVLVAVGAGLWVLFLGNIYIKIGLDKLDYFRWKLLVIESGLIGIVMGYSSLVQLINSRLDFVSNVGLGFCLVILYFAFNVRTKFRKT